MKDNTELAPKRIPVFYCREMAAQSDSFSPSAAKPKLMVESWLARRLPIDVLAPVPASVADLTRSHSADYVLGVLRGERLNGFQNRSLEVANSLPFTNGAMLSAARHVVANGGFACAPCSGFHHAGFERASGYCTFNGLTVTALALHQTGQAKRVGILDCDMHDGDGTREILQRVATEDYVEHFSTGASFYRKDQVNDFFRRLTSELQRLATCDVVLYQAGADPHVDDPLGGWLTSAELRERDRIVFRALAKTRTPVVWNFAGGYQQEPDGSIPKVMAIHDATLEECLSALPERWLRR
jgi:acetoin utilization deacetylase AcuC-like enzyme